MTHDQYLEQYHEITSKVIPDIALRLGRDDLAGGAELLTRLRAKLDDLWSQRTATTAREVNP